MGTNMITVRKRLNCIFLGFTYLIIMFLSSHNLIAQENQDASFKEYKGVVVDGKNKKSLEYASISVTNSNIATISNLEGVFSLKVPDSKKNENLVISYLGYKSKTIPLSSFSSEQMTIALEESFESLPDVNLVEVDPVTVIKKVIENRRSNSYREPLIARAFYRESIKKRRTYASLSEAVVDIYNNPEGSKVTMSRFQNHVKVQITKR